MNFINKSEQSQVRRTFACDACDLEWTMWRFRGDETIPACPSCALDTTRRAVTAPPVLTTKSQAVDIAQEAMESMGYTNMADNQRVGDTAVIPESAPNAGEQHVMGQQAAEMLREWEGANKLSETPQVPGGMSQAQMARDFFKGADGNPMNPVVAGGMMGAHVARQENRDPMAMLHHRKPPINLEVVTSDTGQRGPMVVK
jgi:hypothetical protein